MIYDLLLQFNFNLVKRHDIDFEFIVDHSSLIWLNLIAIYFMVAYSDFVIVNFYMYVYMSYIVFFLNCKSK